MNDGFLLEDFKLFCASWRRFGPCGPACDKPATGQVQVAQSEGHVGVLDGASGKLPHVWNSLCSDRSGLLQPASCPQSDSAIWGRAGAVIDPASGNILVATGNAPWDGKTVWGDAMIELNPDATAMLGNYTPADTAALNTDDPTWASAIGRRPDRPRRQRRQNSPAQPQGHRR